MGGKQLAVNTVYYSIGQILQKGIQFVLLPVYLNYLSPSEYGKISSVSVLVALLTVFYTLALDRSIFRLYFDFTSLDDKKSYLSTIFLGLIVFSSIFTSIIFTFPEIIGNVYKNIDFYPYLSIAVLAIFFNNFSLVPLSILYVTDKALRYVLLSLTQFIVVNLFIVYFVVFAEEGVIGYLKGQLFGAALLAPMFIVITIRFTNIRFNLAFFKKALTFSLPILPSLVSAWVMNLSDRIFIERYIDSYQVGIYSFSYNISSLVLVFSGAFYQAYNPYYFKTASESGTRIEAITILRQTNTFYLLLIIFLCSGISLFAKEVVLLFFDDEYLSSIAIISLITFSYAFGNATGIFRLALYQDKKPAKVMYVTFIGAGVNILLNFLLIQPFGVYGAVYATLITYILLYFVEYFYARKAFYASFDGYIVYLTFAFSIVLNIIFYFINMPLNPWFSLILKAICYLSICYLMLNRYKKFLVLYSLSLKKYI